MALAFDTSAEATDASTPATVSVTPTNTANRVAIGFFFANSFDPPTPTAATFAGNSMTSVGSVATAGDRKVYIFAIKGDANIPAGSAQTFSVTFTGAAGFSGVGILIFNGADQTTGWQNFNSATGTTSGGTGDPSLTITSANGNIVCGCTVDDNASSRTIVNGTSVFQETSGDGNYLCSRRASTTGSTNLSWDLPDGFAWAFAGVDVIAAGAGNSSSVSPSVSLSPSPSSSVSPSSSISPSVSLSPSPSASQSPSSSVSPSPPPLLVIERTVLDYID